MKHTVQRDTPILEAFAGGDAHARTVVDGARILGMLLLRDVLALAAEGRDLSRMCAADAMHEDPVRIIDTSNKLAMARKFAEHRIKSLVVCDEGGNYIRDIDPPEAIAALPSGLMGFFLPAERFMVRNPFDVAADANMEEALHRLSEHRVSCLLVHDFTGETVGMITEADIMQWLLDGRPAQRVAERMSSPVACMSDQSNLMQVWAEMNAMRVMKMVMLGYDQSVSGLLTATDILVALSQNMLETFDRYQCPRNTDMLLEWHRGGMIMAVNDRVLARLRCRREDMVGLNWARGLEDMTHDHLLGLGADSEMSLQWRHRSHNGEETTLQFVARRDTEQPLMWWTLA